MIVLAMIIDVASLRSPISQKRIPTCFAFGFPNLHIPLSLPSMEPFVTLYSTSTILLVNYCLD